MEIQEFLKRYRFKPNDLLGQNFLINDETLDRIADSAEISQDSDVMEIGSGIGNLTKRLAARAKFVLAVEKDERYFPILKDELGSALQTHTRTPKQSANVSLVFADVMRFHFQERLRQGYIVVANIPYYITGKIIEMLLLARNKPSRIVLLVQKEVAQRIVAKPGEMSILAISAQLYADPKIISVVPKEDFYPQPKVDSAILLLDILPAPRFAIDEKKFFRVVKAAFAGKRKQLRNTLKNNLKLTEGQIRSLEERGIVNTQSRPQELTLQQWHALYNAVLEFAKK